MVGCPLLWFLGSDPVPSLQWAPLHHVLCDDHRPWIGNELGVCTPVVVMLS